MRSLPSQAGAPDLDGEEGSSGEGSAPGSRDPANRDLALNGAHPNHSDGSQVNPTSGSEDDVASPAIREVYGSAKNIEVHGSPIEKSGREPIRYYFYPTWRSQLSNLCGFFALCVVCVIGSRYIPYVVIPGKLVSLFGVHVILYLPVLILLPGFMLGRILMNIYDAKYIIDDGGVEAQIGLVSFNLRQPRLRWEDIRGSEPQQTIWERILGIGSVLIGSAMTQDVEIVMSGVANPRAIQLLIQGERDRRLKELRASANHGFQVRELFSE